MGSPQIRHVATIGGNLCNGAVIADSVPILLAYNVLLEIVGHHGPRIMPVTEFHTGPGETVLEKDRELLTTIVIPRVEYEGRYAHYLKFGQRNAMEIATLGCAVQLKLTAGKRTIDDIRIAFSVAAPIPIRCRETEKLLRGMPLSANTIKFMRKSVQTEIRPRDSWRSSRQLRLQVAKELCERAFCRAAMAAGGSLQ